MNKITSQEVVNQAANVVNDALKAMPKSSRGIAEFLHRRGITGKRGSSGNCPIRNYLRSVLDQAGLFTEVEVRVNGGRFNVLRIGRYGDFNYARVQFTNPAAVGQFIDEFDETKKYKYLLPQEATS